MNALTRSLGLGQASSWPPPVRQATGVAAVTLPAQSNWSSSNRATRTRSIGGIAPENPGPPQAAPPDTAAAAAGRVPDPVACDRSVVDGLRYTPPSPSPHQARPSGRVRDRDRRPWVLLGRVRSPVPSGGPGPTMTKERRRA